jgi:outer membrane protein
MKTTALAILLIALTIPAFAAPPATGQRIGIVNSDEVLMTSKPGKKLASSLEKFRQKKLKEIEDGGKKLKAEEGRLKTEQEGLIRQRDLVGEEAFKTKVLAFEKKMRKFQEKAMIWEQSKVLGERELIRKKQELEKPFLQKLLAVAEAVAKEQGYDVVLDRAAVLYSQRNNNLTDEVVKRLNKK